MSRDSGSKDPSQRTVAELLAEHGGDAQRGSRRRRRRAEDPSETAPQAIIERVNSDSGRMLPVEDAGEEDAGGEVPESSGPDRNGQAQANPATAETYENSAPETARRSVSGSAAAPPRESAGASRSGSSEVRGVRFSPEQGGPAQRVGGRQAPVVRPRGSGQDSRPPAEGGASEENGRAPAEDPPGTDQEAGQEADREQGQWTSPQPDEQTYPVERDIRGGAPPDGRPTLEEGTDGSAADIEVTAQQPALPATQPGQGGEGPYAGEVGPGAAPPQAEPPAAAPNPALAPAPAPASGGDPRAQRQAEEPAPVVREDVTERFPSVPAAAASPGDSEMTDGDGTTLLRYPEIPEEQPVREFSGAGSPSDPYEGAYYEADAPHEDPFAAVEDFYGGVDDEDLDDEVGATDGEYTDEDDLDRSAESSLPAGLKSSDEEFDSDYADPDSTGRSRVMEWVMLAGQTLGGLVVGGLVWIGFRWLWRELPLPALAAALVFTGALVLGARKVLRTDDLQTILLSVLVGLACTVSPVALLLVGH